MFGNNPLRCKLSGVRLSYAYLNEPQSPKNGQGDPAYSVKLLIPKSDTAALADIKSAIEAAAQKGVSSMWGGIRPPRLEDCIYDGDGVDRAGKPYGTECKGHWMINTRCWQKPNLVGYDATGALYDLAASEVYSGMYADVTFIAKPYNNSGNRGVRFQLQGVCKIRDGEMLTSNPSAEDDFGNGVPRSTASTSDFARTAAPAAPAAAPMQQGWPQANPMPTAAPAAPAYQPPYSAPAANPAPWNGATQTYATGGAVNPLTGNPM